MNLTTRMVIAVAIVTLEAGPAFAQTLTRVRCDHPLLGAALGAATNGDRNGSKGTYPDNHSGTAADVGASFDVPVADPWGARVDVGSVAWTFQSTDPSGVPLLRNRVRVTRATVSATKVVAGSCGSPVRGYVGAGIGAYRYRFGEGGEITRAGVHGLLGLDVMVSERTAVTIGGAVRGARGPGRAPVFSHVLWIVQLDVGAKFRF